MIGAKQYSTFHAGEFHFALDVEHVQEVVQPMVLTPVPLTSNVINGLVNLRGQIITAIDLRARLELPQLAAVASSVSLIVRTSSGLISVRADRLGDVLDRDCLSLEQSASREQYGEDDLEDADLRFALDPLPDTVQGPIREVVQGVIPLTATLLLVLEPERLLTAETALQIDETDV